MPQASDAQRARWNGPSDKTATEFLRSRGFVLSPAWTWVREKEPDEKEWDAISFMVNEWDYGLWETPAQCEANNKKEALKKGGS